MLLEKLTGFDVGLWDRSILTEESKSLFKRGTFLNSLASLTKCFFFLFLISNHHINIYFYYIYILYNVFMQQQQQQQN